jgi:hypothetical protein
LEDGTGAGCLSILSHKNQKACRDVLRQAFCDEVTLIV